MPLHLTATALREAAFMARMALMPLTQTPPSPQAVVDPNRLPVVLVHGYMGHPEMLRPLTHRLLTDGWGTVVRVRYSSTRLSMDAIIQKIADIALPLAEEHGQVDLVGHSLGAVACRAWVKLKGGAPSVRRLISLGGPHAGTSLYRLVPSPVRHALRPDGKWVRALAEGPEPVPITVIRARYDHQVFPPRRAAIPGVLEQIVDSYGHNGLLWSTRTHNLVVRALES